MKPRWIRFLSSQLNEVDRQFYSVFTCAVFMCGRLLFKHTYVKQMKLFNRAKRCIHIIKCLEDLINGIKGVSYCYSPCVWPIAQPIVGSILRVQMLSSYFTDGQAT